MFRPMLLPDLSALLALKQPLTPEVTSLARRPGGDGQLGGTSTLSGYCNNGWKRRRYRRGQGRALDDNRFDCAATDNGTDVRYCIRRRSHFSFLKPMTRRQDKILAIANRSRVSCAHNTLRAYRLKYYTMTLKSRLRVTQGH